MSENRYIPASVAAEKLGVTSATIRRWLREGKVAGKMINRKWYVMQDELDNLDRKLRGGKIINEQPETFWAWLAGLIDGDGTISLNVVITSHKNKKYLSFRPCISITQGKKEALETIRDKIGRGHVGQAGQGLSGERSWYLIINDIPTVTKVGERILPYLLFKRRHMEIILEYTRMRFYESVSECRNASARRWRAGELIKALKLSREICELNIKGKSPNHMDRVALIPQLICELEKYSPDEIVNTHDILSNVLGATPPSNNECPAR